MWQWKVVAHRHPNLDCLPGSFAFTAPGLSATLPEQVGSGLGLDADTVVDSRRDPLDAAQVRDPVWSKNQHYPCQLKIGVVMRNKKWVRLLAYVTGSVNQELLLQNECLATENRILRAQLPSRLRYCSRSSVLINRTVTPFTADNVSEVCSSTTRAPHELFDHTGRARIRSRRPQRTPAQWARAAGV
jgi:hypothetical protein